MPRRFWEQNWPSILVFCITVVICSFAIKYLFFHHKNDKGDIVTIVEMLEGLHQNDTRLLDHIIKNHLFPPASYTKPYNLISTTEDRNESSNDYYIGKILQEKINGFFLEYRSYEGEFLSKTLDLEQSHNWTGVLIEPDPSMFLKLVSKHRKAWMSNICLSPDPHPQKLDFMRRIHTTTTSTAKSSLVSLLNDDDNNSTSKPNATNGETNLKVRGKENRWQKVRITCFPLLSLLSALRVKTIDYFILSAQGLELQILLNIPWDSVFIKVLSVDVQWIPEGTDVLISFMKRKNYSLVVQVHQDYIFAHQSLPFLDNFEDE